MQLMWVCFDGCESLVDSADVIEQDACNDLWKCEDGAVIGLSESIDPVV